MTRVLMLISALLFVGISTAVGQTAPPTPINEPPVEPEPGSQATIKFTEQPTPTDLLGVNSKMEWTNSTGIKEVKVQVMGKDGKGMFTVELGSETISTTQADGKAVQKVFADAQKAKAGDKVKVVITSYDMNGREIKSKTSDEVTLKN